MTSHIVIGEPGVYDGLSDAAYHADPVPGGSLSSTGARRLLPPSCPARFHHERTHGRPPKVAFDIGHAAHHLALGTGPELVVIDADNWRTKAAREQRDAAYAAGQVPLLAADHQRVTAMASVLQAHSLAAALLDPATGQAEQSLFWVDPQAETWCRARYDFLRNQANGRPLIVDYKTCDSADLDHIQRAIHRYGYHQQAAFYLDGGQQVGIDDLAFVLVFQEIDPPHLITVVQPDPVALRIGRDLNRQAIDIYAECTRTGVWPAYSDDIELIALPAWVERQHTKEIW